MFLISAFNQNISIIINLYKTKIILGINKR